MDTFIQDALRACGIELPSAALSPAAPISVAPAQPNPASSPAGCASATYRAPAWFADASDMLASAHCRGAMLFGPRGSGKTRGATELARLFGADLIHAACNRNTIADDFVGRFTAPAEFADGPLTRAVRADCWLLVDEANAADPGVWSELNPLIDESGAPLTLPTGETIPIGERFRLLLTFNEGYVGMRAVNQALKDRLAPVWCAYPDAQVESGILLADGYDALEVGRAMTLANAVRAVGESIQFDLSVRALRRMLGLRQRNRTWSESFRIAILDMIGGPLVAKPQRDAVLTAARSAGLDAFDGESNE